VAVSVRIAGKSGSLKIELKKGATARDVLAEAIESLGLEAEVLDKLFVVVNGESANEDRLLEEGDRVSAAGQLANG
jgi:molybdopterin converting factor small subunit